VGEVGAQLDAVGTTLGGRERRVQGLNGCLEENGHQAEAKRERKT